MSGFRVGAILSSDMTMTGTNNQETLIMNKDQKLSSQQVRDDYLKLRAQRRAPDSLGPVVVVDAIPGDADGLMPIATLNSDIALKVPDWGTPAGPLPGAVEELRLEWRYEDEPDYVELWFESWTEFPITEPFPLVRAIGRDFFDGREGRFSFRYGVKGWNDLEMSYSEVQPITIDRTPVYGQQDPPAVEDPGPVNDTVLDAAGGVVLTIPDFIEEKKEFVTIAVVWASKPPPANEPIHPDLTVVLPADRKVLVPRSVIEALTSGDHYVAYELFDKAGNRSRPSSVRTIKVALGPLPEALSSPFVPLAPDTDGNLIDLKDAHTGVYVEVPHYQNHHPSDQAVVTWGTGALPGVAVGVAEDPFPVEVPVHWAHLKAQYTNDPDTQATPVTYKIVRGTTDFELEPSKAISVNVNFGYTGPVNPDEPSPVNPDLQPVIVRGDSAVDNHLDETDTGKPATATITVYDPPRKNDVITLYWNGMAVADTVTLDAEGVGDEVTIDILWPEIEAGMSGNVPVWYTLNNPDFLNEQRSRDTLVQVDAVPIILDPATFPDIVDAEPDPDLEFWVLNCSSLRKRSTDQAIGYRVHIPASRYLVAGEGTELRWVLKKADGTTEVAGSELKEPVTIPADAPTQGFGWFVAPYDPHILLAYNEPGHYAYAEVTYSLTIEGKPVVSQLKPEIVGIRDLSVGGSCDLTDITPLP